MIGQQLPLFTPSKRPRQTRRQHLTKLANRTEANNPDDRQARQAFELAIYSDSDHRQSATQDQGELFDYAK